MKNLTMKLCKIMSQVSKIPKNGRNDFHNYDYVTESDISDSLRDSLAKENVFIFSDVKNISKEGTVTTVEIEFTLMDADSGDNISLTYYGTGADKGDKGIYKAYAGALKYFLMKQFMISSGDDPEKVTDPQLEKELYHNKPPQKSKTKTQPQPKTQPQKPQAPKEELITKAEQKLIFNSANQNTSIVKQTLLEFGYTNTKNIPRCLLQDVLKKIEAKMDALGGGEGVV